MMDTKELVWIDEENSMVFMLAGDIQKGMATKLAQWIRYIEK